MLESLRLLSQGFLETKSQNYRRYFIQETDLTEQFSILLGQRGIGKTTMIVQYLLDYAKGDRFSTKILYVPVDHFSVGNLKLYEIAENFSLMGGKLIAFDEIHKYKNWSSELKSINDTFPDLKIIASGSSALEIQKGSHDLSRRAIVYNIPCLSLREYLELRLDCTFPKHPLTDILSNHSKQASDIIKLLGTQKQKILSLFSDYLKHGYYPYYLELQDQTKFNMTLEQNIHTTLESDITAIYPKLSHHSINKMKKLLVFIAECVPFKPNWRELKNLIEVGDERTLKNYFKYLEDAELISLVSSSSTKLSRIDNPSKVYLNNPNTMHAISKQRENIGTVRELFFYNMLSTHHKVSIPINGDFLIENDLVFEVGGRKKSNRQIYQEKHGYLACDNLEIGINNKIPLWLFGFIY